MTLFVGGVLLLAAQGEYSRVVAFCVNPASVFVQGNAKQIFALHLLARTQHISYRQIAYHTLTNATGKLTITSKPLAIA